MYLMNLKSIYDIFVIFKYLIQNMKRGYQNCQDLVALVLMVWTFYYTSMWICCDINI